MKYGKQNTFGVKTSACLMLTDPGMPEMLNYVRINQYT